MLWLPGVASILPSRICMQYEDVWSADQAIRCRDADTFRFVPCSNNFTKCRKEQKSFEEALEAAKTGVSA